MTESLPEFRYHPDPVGTGAVVAEETDCIVCGRIRSHRYGGPIYTRRRPDGAVCPWCIADGRAAATLQAEFVGDISGAAEVDAAALEELARRTPGYTAWQQEIWLTHCSVPATFVGPVGKVELEALPSSASAAVREVLRDWARSEDERDQMFHSLHRDGDFTAYLFVCEVCGNHLAHVDAG